MTKKTIWVRSNFEEEGLPANKVVSSFVRFNFEKQ